MSVLHDQLERVLPPGMSVPQPILSPYAWIEANGLSGFGVSIPETALAIVKHPAEMGDEDSPDSFCRWVRENAG